MKKGFLILFTLITLGAWAQAHNPNPQAFTYSTLAEAIRKPMDAGSKFSVKGQGDFMDDVLNAGEVADNGLTILKPNGHVMRRDISQSPVINAKWFTTTGNASAAFQTMLNLSVSTGLPVDGNGLTLNVNDITLPAKASLRNITLNGSDATKAIAHIGTVGQVPADGYQSGLILDNVTFTGTCSYGLIVSNVTDVHIDKITFTNLNTVNDAWYLNDVYEASITAPRFTTVTAGIGKACLYSPKGVNAVDVKDIYISAFTDYGIKITGGANLDLTNAVVQGSTTGLYITGVLGSKIKYYSENVVNPIVIDDANGTPTGIVFTGGSGYITGPFVSHPHIDQDNGVMVKVKNAQVQFDNVRFAGVSSSSTKKIASVDGSAIVTLHKPTITGNLTADIRQYLYKESTATSVAGYNLDQVYTNNSNLVVQRTLGGSNAHITTVRNATGEMQESSSWVPPVNGSGAQTVTDVWKKTWTESNLDSSLFARKPNVLNDVTVSNDSLFQVKNGTKTFVNKFTGGGGGGIGTESDPVFNTSVAKTITTPNITDWNNKLAPSYSAVLYFPAFIFERGFEVPNVAGIKDSSLNVSGNKGNNYLLVNSGNKVAFYNQGAFPVAVFNGANNYNTYYTTGIKNDTVYLSTPLQVKVSLGTLKTVHDSYQGQHLTDIAYKALADYIFNLDKTRAYKNNLAYFDPATNPTVIPFSLIGGATIGGFIPGTDLPQIAQISSVTTSSAALGSKGYYVQQGTTAGKGVQWSITTAGKSGYVSMNIGLAKRTYNTTLSTAGRAVVKTYIDGAVAATDTISQFNVQTILHPFSKADSIRLTVTTLDTIPTSVAISRTGFYETADTTSTPMFAATDKVVFLGDSWTQYTMNGTTPNKDMVNRFKGLFAAKGGDSANNVINVGRSGMTSAWGKYWFDSLVLSKHPSYVILEFYTNDNNSSGSVGNATDLRWNFSGTDPFNTSGTDQEGKVSATQWNANMNWMAQRALANGITPIIFMSGWSGSIAQTQAVLDSFLVKQATNTYYDVKGLSSYNATVVNNMTADNINAVTSATVPTLNATKITGGSAVIGGFPIIETKETNSATAKGIVFRPDAFRAYSGSVGHLFTIQNGTGSNAYTDIAYLLNDGTWVTPKLAPTTNIKVPAGTSTQAPLTYTAGTNVNAPASGMEEFDGTNKYFTPSIVRKRYALTNNVTPANGQIPIGNGTDYTVSNITQGYGMLVTNGSGSIAAAVDTTIIATKAIIPATFWQRSGTTISPLTAGDNLTISGTLKLNPVAGTFTGMDVLMYDIDNSVKRISSANFLNAQHPSTTGSAPGVAGGTNVSAAINTTGKDAKFQLTLVVGAGGATGTLATITFNTAWGGTPIAVFSAANTAAAGTTIAADATSSTTLPVIGTLAAGTYVFNFICEQ